MPVGACDGVRTPLVDVCDGASAGARRSFAKTERFPVRLEAVADHANLRALGEDELTIPFEVVTCMYSMSCSFILSINE